MNYEVGVLDSLRYRFRLLEHKIKQYRLTTNETVIADTEYGKIKGVKRTTIYDDTFLSFEKIPYAKPPINDLRFKAPEQPLPWTDVLDCTQGSPKSLQLQFTNKRVEGSEDCLYLNVYTKNLQPDQPRPVMIWIHGGGFVTGEATRDWYCPDLLMKKDIVLVTINYRLGALGFLSLKDPKLDVPGNAGLKDQVLAIKWVKNNCSKFGGNPNNITVFGESAGAASTHYMTMTDQVKDHFQHAILMSGCALAPWAMSERNNKYVYRLARATGYSGEENEKEMLEHLMKTNASNLVNDDNKLLTPEDHRRGVLFCFGPTIEPYVTKHCVISKSPEEMMKTAWGNKIPVMIGNTSSEGLFFYPAMKMNPKMLDELDTCAKFVPKELANENESNKLLELGKILKEAHVNNGSNNRLDSLIDILGFQHFINPMQRFLLRRAKYAQAPTYIYRFDFYSENLINPFRMMRWGKGVPGVSHTDELSYLFHTLFGRRMDKNSKEYKMIERMVGIFTNFASVGDPNCEVISNLNWEPIEKDAIAYKCLNISDELGVLYLPEMDKIKAWDSMYPKDLL